MLSTIPFRPTAVVRLPWGPRHPFRVCAPEPRPPSRRLAAATALVQPDQRVAAIVHALDDPLLLLVSDARDVRVELATLRDAVEGKAKQSGRKLPPADVGSYAPVADGGGLD